MASRENDSNKTESTKILNAASEEFREATKNSAELSDRGFGERYTGRQLRVHTVFTNLICHCIAVLSLIDEFEQSDHEDIAFVNHQSISVLGRAIIDACLMTLYLSNLDLGRDEWDLRRQVLFLHDLANRRRFLKAFAASIGEEDKEFMDSYPETRDSIKSRISELAKSLGYEQEEIKDLRRGQKTFINGLRGAVRETGWDVDEFDAIHTYLSNFVHSHPVSYMRAQHHGISYFEPSDFQMAQCAMVLSTCANYVSDVNERLEVFLASYDADPVGQLN